MTADLRFYNFEVPICDEAGANLTESQKPYMFENKGVDLGGKGSYKVSLLEAKKSKSWAFFHRYEAVCGSSERKRIIHAQLHDNPSR